jgi:hypothetical protein
VGLSDISCEGVEFIHLAEDRDQWQTPVNRGINCWVLLAIGLVG